MGDDIKMEVEDMDNRTPLKKTYAVSFQTDIIHEDIVNEISRNSRFQQGEGKLCPNNFAKFC